tara:strand:- start:43 stop:480 length:438 start_codon:yes stop_codon:yes gene_type:complete
MRPFDQAWRLLKSYTSGKPYTRLSERTGQPHGYVPFGHTSLPGADIGVTSVPQESDKDFREHAKYLEWRDSPAMQRRLMEHEPSDRQFFFEDRPTPEDALGEVGHAANFSTAQMLDEHAKRMGTDQFYAQTGMVPGDSRFTSYGQ